MDLLLFVVVLTVAERLIVERDNFRENANGHTPVDDDMIRHELAIGVSLHLLEREIEHHVSGSMDRGSS